MGDPARSPGNIIALPQGGGAVRGIGETFQPDPQTGTGNLTVPIAVPAGRRSLQPSLSLGYSTGAGNGWFGLGWALSVPGVARKTSRGVPVYDDSRDTFVLSGADELVPVETTPVVSRYRPRTDGLFARIVHHHDRAAGADYWEVTTPDGLRSRYGSLPSAADPAVISDPAQPAHIFAWHLTETRDQLGNVVVYEYDLDSGSGGGHRWRQPLLRRIRYADLPGGDFLAEVTLEDEERPDAFSSYTSGFEIRTSRRYRAVRTAVRFDDRLHRVRDYELGYRTDTYNGVSLLETVAVVGYDDDGSAARDLPPVRFGYRGLDPAGWRLKEVTGPDLPSVAMSRGDHELVDLTGDGLPDVLQLNGTARYWRNLGGGRLDRPRPMATAPAGLSLTTPGVQLLDADGDGCADLMVTDGFYPLRFGPSWGRFRRYPAAPGFDLDDPRVHLLDLDADGITDVVVATRRWQCFFADEQGRWRGPLPARSAGDEDPPSGSPGEGRMHFADMVGDGASDLVLLNGRTVEYRPNLGHGVWGDRVRMGAADGLPDDDGAGVLVFGDVDGDGLADLVHVGGHTVTVWFNRSGNGWSPPVRIPGVPWGGWDVRITDFLGTGTGGVLFSRDHPGQGRASMYFLDVSGGVKPRLLTEVDNQIGAVTRVGYRPSSAYATDPDVPWRTTLPFVVPVVSRVETVDGISSGTLTSVFDYRHGHYDGLDRQFCGFGRVEQADTDSVGDSPPALTRTWFHLGHELDLAAEYWPGDPGLLATEPDGRDGLRALRGRVLRSELYGLDGDQRQDRPYTVVEHAYAVREEAPGVFFGAEVSSRTTQWERGTDPMTRFHFAGDHDAHGQPRRQTEVVPPRRSTRRLPVEVAPVRDGAARTLLPDVATVLATHSRTSYAVPDPEVPVHDRVAQTRVYELREPPGVDEERPGDVTAVLADQLRAAEAVRAVFDRLDAADVRLIGHERHHYDGAAYAGRPVGELGPFGLLTRSEQLVFRDGDGGEDTLTAAYGTWRPAYLGGAEPVPDGAPAGFGTTLGYRHEPGAGWYADTARTAYDVQLTTAAEPLPGRGLVLGVEDPCGRQILTTPDRHWLLPAEVRDAAGLITTVTYDYRTGRPARIVDANGHPTTYRYHPLGLLAAVITARGTAERPELSYRYDFAAYADRGQPISVYTTVRVWHADDLGDDVVPAGAGDDVVASREYSDGFGRLLQKRSQADDLIFPDDESLGLLVPDQAGIPQPVPGRAGGPARGVRSGDRVVVSGWQTFDNKGRPVETFEPEFGTGWDFQPPGPGDRRAAVRTYYDARGQVVRVRYPDGSERRTVFGSADAPDPWTVVGYDQNDLAPVSTGPSGAALTGRAPPEHHFTPETFIHDGLGRPLCRIRRAGAGPGAMHAVQTGYDVRGNALTVTDELGRVALRHAYDLTGRAMRTDSIDGGRLISVTDAAGQTVASRDSRGCVTLRTYDGLNRPAEVWARDDPDAALTLRERLTYGDAGSPQQPAAERAAARAGNLLGRLWQHLDEAGLLVLGYDFGGRVTGQTRRVVSDDAIAAAEPAGWTADWAAPGGTAALDPAGAVTATRFDAVGRAVRVVTPTATADAPDRVVTFAHSRSGALREVAVDGVPYLRLLVHNARGQRVLCAFGSGLVTRYDYEPDTFRLRRLRTERMTAGPDDTWTAAGGPALQDLTHGYDLAGNLTSIEERVPGCGVAGTADGRDALRREFAYDPLYRLTAATGRAAADIPVPRPLDEGTFPAAPNQANAPEVTAGYRETYTYDPAGNLLEMVHRLTTGAPAGWRRTFELGVNNQVVGVRNGDNPAVPRHHDEAGNLDAEAESRAYRWDHAGRLTGFRVSAGAGTSVAARYLYAADGTRVKKWVRRGGQDESTTVAGPVEHFRWTAHGGGHNSLLHVADDTGRIALIRTGADLHPDDASPAVRLELRDHLGSEVLTLDGAGAWTNREEFFPYGETSFGSFARKRYRFTGMERDLESGLSHHGARYYAPAVARWTSPDPAGPADGLNLYRYARNNPMGGTDPSGTQTNGAAGAADVHPITLPSFDPTELGLPAPPPAVLDAMKKAQPLTLMATPEQAESFLADSAAFESYAAQLREALAREREALNPPPQPPMEQVAINGFVSALLTIVQPQLLGSAEGMAKLDAMRPLPYTAEQERAFGGGLRLLEGVWGMIVQEAVTAGIGVLLESAATKVLSAAPRSLLTLDAPAAASVLDDLPFRGRTVLVDENLSPTLVPMLRGQGINASRVARGELDEAIIRLAARDNAIVLTINVDDFAEQGVTVIGVHQRLGTAQARAGLTQQLINLGERSRLNPDFLRPGQTYRIR